MKILHVITVFPKVSETFVLDIITRLISEGHPAIILSKYHQEVEPTFHQDISTFGLLQNTYFVSDFIHDEEQKIVWNSEFREELQDVDIIISHFADIPAQIAITLSNTFCIPFVCFAHARDIFVNNYKENLDHLIRHASKIIVPTKYNKSYLVNQLGIEFNDKIEIIRCGIDIEIYAPRPNQASSSEKIMICIIGRLIEKKGVEYAIRAFNIIQRSHPQIRLKIIGDGEMREYLRTLTEDLDLSDKVKFLGVLDHSQISYELKESSIFVLPSITTSNGGKEGLPISILEAMATGLPVIATNHSGVPEVITDGINGFLVEEKNIAALVDKLELLITNPLLRAKMGKNARARIVKEYKADLITNQLITLLKNYTKDPCR